MSDFDLELDDIDEVELDDDIEESDDNLEVAQDENKVDLASQQGWVGMHPAEIAAAKIKKSSGNSEDQLLRDLRKDIFTIPLLKQAELLPLFNQLDSIIVSIVNRILSSSCTMRSRVVDIMVKVAAGNTYNKNIYEKEQSSLEKRPRSTYKDHEIDFMNRCYEFLREVGNNEKLDSEFAKPQFIRGVYEEILEEFVDSTKSYVLNHHQALQARLNNDGDKFVKHLAACNIIENKMQFRNQLSYSIIRDAEQAHKKYIEIRSVIIAPYLRSVFSLAKNLGKNVHQTLDNFQNGSMGLIRAVSCYSTVRPTSFSSVAKGWIKQMMLLSIKEEANFVKLPIATWQAFTSMERVRQKAGVEIEDYQGIATANKVPLEKVKNIYEAVKLSQVFSINKTYDQNEKLTLEDVIPDEKEDDGDVIINELREYIDKAQLCSLEKKVIALTHGIADIIASKPLKEEDVEKERLVQSARRVGFVVYL
jgi:DNA-directed RNA polymerase sigma subunit (sigma70/sigma32)